MKEKLEEFVKKYHNGTDHKVLSNAKHKSYVDQEAAIQIAYNTKDLKEFLDTYKLYEEMRDSYENK